MSIVYSIIWLLGILLTLFWLIGSFFKPAKMGGKETWGTTNFKASMLWSLSLVFVFIFKLNSINLLILLPYRNGNFWVNFNKSISRFFN